MVDAVWILLPAAATVRPEDDECAVVSLLLFQFLWMIDSTSVASKHPLTRPADSPLSHCHPPS